MHAWCYTVVSTATDNSRGGGVLRRSDRAGLAGTGVLQPLPLQPSVDLSWLPPLPHRGCVHVCCATEGACAVYARARFGELSFGELAAAATWA